MSAPPASKASPVVGCLWFLSIPFAVALRAWTLRVLWGWFAVVDFGMAPLTWHSAVGLSVLTAFLTHQFNPNEPTGDADSRLLRLLGHWFVGPLWVLGLGGLYHLCTRGLS